MLESEVTDVRLERLEGGDLRSGRSRTPVSQEGAFVNARGADAGTKRLTPTLTTRTPER